MRRKTEANRRKNHRKCCFCHWDRVFCKHQQREGRQPGRDCIRSISDLAIPSHSCKFLCSGLAKLLFFFFRGCFSVCLSCFVIRIMQIPNKTSKKVMTTNDRVVFRFAHYSSCFSYQHKGPSQSKNTYHSALNAFFLYLN